MKSSFAGLRAVKTLSFLFLAYKSILLLLALLSPGLGYDTSTSLLEQSADIPLVCETPTNLTSSVLKLTRWDAIYFTSIARRGHLFEQEWAFGIGLSDPVSFVKKAFGADSLTQTTVIAVTISHFAHWLSVLIIFAIVSEIYTTKPSPIPLISAALHIISPAGIFLSAPYSESLFSLLNTFGTLLYVKGLNLHRETRHDAGNFATIASGFVLGCATIVRSNGILSGLPFLGDAILQLGILIQGSPKLPVIFRLSFLGAAGLLVLGGFMYPQYLAYRAYCSVASTTVLRPWCKALVPSIYTWVQSYYWNVGFLRYWTASNLPLFMLASPAIWHMVRSAIDVPRNTFKPSKQQNKAATVHRRALLVRLAIPQLVLALLAVTNYHIQVITRLSSGYVIWYIWIGQKIEEFSRAGMNTGKLSVRWMVLYGVIQAGLYASFLPPA